MPISSEHQVCNPTRLSLALVASLTITCIAAAAPDDAKKKVRFGDMDYGPAFMYTVDAPPKGNLVYKGLTVRLAGGKLGALFDMDLMRWAAVWKVDPQQADGKLGVLDLSKTNMTSEKGNALALPAGDPIVYTMPGRGWAIDGDWTDPRPSAKDEKPRKRETFEWNGASGAYGPLPKDQAHWSGHYLVGDKVVLSYTVADTHVLEMLDAVERDGTWYLTRSFEVGPSKHALTVRVFDSPQAEPIASDGGHAQHSLALRRKVDGKTLTTQVVIQSKLEGVKLAPLQRPGKSNAFGVAASLATSKQTRRFKVAIWSDSDERQPAPYVRLDAPDLSTLTKNDTPRWREPVVTKGVVASSNTAEPYVLDRIVCPETNPWHAWMRPTGFDFFEDGASAAVCTWNGDVWIVNGIDDKLYRLEWRRFATGLHEPLGVVVMDGTVYTVGRDQITRLHDLNHDGEADWYENLNNDGITWPRTMALTLHRDAEGNLYYIKNGNRVPGNVPLQGCVFKVPRDGSKLEVYATGFRSANGMSVSPTGQVTVADQEGNWVPTTRIDLVKPGRFYGYRPHSHGLVPDKPAHEPADDYELPMCWVPKAQDNSAGGQAWVIGDKWGPFNGRLLHISYGHARLFLTMYEQVDGLVQGGFVQFPFRFDTGTMRARFNRRDGQLYVLGMHGWQTDGVRDSGFYRVRYTGKPVYMPTELHVTKQGVRITFTCALKRDLATDTDSYAVERWNYRYTAAYGSPEFSMADPAKKGHDPVEVAAAELSPDGRTVFLRIPTIAPVMQQMIKFDLEAQDGTPVRYELFHTIHRLP